MIKTKLAITRDASQKVPFTIDELLARTDLNQELKKIIKQIVFEQLLKDGEDQTQDRSELNLRKNIVRKIVEIMADKVPDLKTDWDLQDTIVDTLIQELNIPTKIVSKLTEDTKSGDHIPGAATKLSMLKKSGKNGRTEIREELKNLDKLVKSKYINLPVRVIITKFRN